MLKISQKLVCSKKLKKRRSYFHEFSPFTFFDDIKNFYKMNKMMKMRTDRTISIFSTLTFMNETFTIIWDTLKKISIF